MATGINCRPVDVFWTHPTRRGPQCMPRIQWMDYISLLGLGMLWKGRQTWLGWRNICFTLISLNHQGQHPNKQKENRLKKGDGFTWSSFLCSVSHVCSASFIPNRPKTMNFWNQSALRQNYHHWQYCRHDVRHEGLVRGIKLINTPARSFNFECLFLNG